MKRPREVVLLMVGCALLYSGLARRHTPSSIEPIAASCPTYHCGHHFRSEAANHLFLEAEKLVHEPIQSLQVALKIEPDNAGGYYHLARHLHDQQRYFEAIEASTRAIALQPGFASAWNARAYSRAQLEEPAQWEPGLLDIRTALGLDDSEPTFWDTRGYLLFRMGRLAEALPDMDRAVAGEPRRDHLNHRAEVLLSLGRGTEARQDLARAAGALPD